VWYSNPDRTASEGSVLLCGARVVTGKQIAIFASSVETPQNRILLS